MTKYAAHEPLQMFATDQRPGNPKVFARNIRAGNYLYLKDLQREFPSRAIMPALAPAEPEPMQERKCPAKEGAPSPVRLNLKPPSIAKRLAEVDALRGDPSAKQLSSIRQAIWESARDCGECTLDRTPAQLPKMLSQGSSMIIHIQTVVANHFGISVRDMISGHRAAKMVWPRHVAMYLARQLTTHGRRVIGRYFGNRDSTTVLNSVRKITNLILADRAVAEEIAALCGMLSALPQRCYFRRADGYRYPMTGFDADMMLAILNDHEPFYWGA